MVDYKVKDEFSGEDIGLKKWKVTFTERKKYKPITRSVIVETVNDLDATDIVLGRFGGIKAIGVNSVVEAKENDE